MKKIYFTLAILFLAISSAFSQDSLYVYKNGLVDTKFGVYDIDSLSFSNNLDTLILSKNNTVTNTILIANIDSISFMPSLPTGTYIDIDGNRYTTVTIGTQTWMVENLKTTRYRNGDTIPEVKDNAAWINLTTGAYSNYDNDPNNGDYFGRLYNWHAVNDSRNLAPAGWYIPSIEEWETLQNYLIENGYNYDNSTTGNKTAKSLASKTDWKSSSSAGAPGNNMAINNISKFNALPGGGRYHTSGNFFSKSEGAFWWVKNESSLNEARYRAIFYGYNYFQIFANSKKLGFSVRCIKSDLPIVSSNMVDSITINSAKSGGNVSFDGHDPILYRGVCWNTSENPTVNDNITIDWNGLGGFSSYLKKLLPGTTYFFRAYATNTVGTAYGEEFSFKTLATTPTITTMEVSAITDSTATASGVIITDGGATITEKGFCWSTNESPTVADSITTGTGDSIFIGNLTGLNAGTVYYIRSFATNEIGTTYGQQLSFTTLPEEDKLTGIQIIPHWIDGGFPAVEVGYMIGITAPVAKVMFNEQNLVYRFNPTAADVSKITWAFINNSAILTAPGQGAPAFQTSLFAAPEFTNNNDGTGTFNLKVENWTEATAGETHLFALQANEQEDINGNLSIVSDYAKVVPVQYNAFISDTIKSNAGTNTYVHYRVPSNIANPNTDLPILTAANDFDLVIGTPVDLDNLVLATADKVGAAERRFETYGFNDYKFEFSLPTYLGDDGVTNQNSFVTLDTYNVLSVNGGSSAIDRNPLVLVKLLTNDGRLVAQSYIKFKVVAN